MAGGVKEKRLIAVSPTAASASRGSCRGSARRSDRTTLAPLGDGRVRQTIERSEDGGTTWNTGFDAVYVHAGIKAPAPEH